VTLHELFDGLVIPRSGDAPPPRFSGPRRLPEGIFFVFYKVVVDMPCTVMLRVTRPSGEDTVELQTVDSARFPHPLSEVVALASGPDEKDQTQDDLMFTTGQAHWSADIRVRLRLADPVRQEANRQRLLDPLAKPGPLWDPVNHGELKPDFSSETLLTPKVYISDAQAVSDFGSVLARVRNGITIVIQHEHRPVAVVQPAEPLRRTVSQCIALAKAHEKETGAAPILDADFASDVEDVLRDREPWQPPEWE
jgi:antitoxin (DNA-binding transcriptional repressor) of toxin-antitoxin stability system